MRRAGVSLMDCPRYCAGVEQVSSVRVRLPFSHLGHGEEEDGEFTRGTNHCGQHSYHKQKGQAVERAAVHECSLQQPSLFWHSSGDPQRDPRNVGREGTCGAVLAQMCKLAVAVPGVSGERQCLHFVEGEVAGQLGEPIVLQVSGLQPGHAGKCIVCKLKQKGFW